MYCRVLQNYSIGNWTNNVEHNESHSVQHASLILFLICSGNLLFFVTLKTLIYICLSLVASQVLLLLSYSPILTCYVMCACRESIISYSEVSSCRRWVGLMELPLEELLIDSVKILTLWYVFVTILAYFIDLLYNMYVEIMYAYLI